MPNVSDLGISYKVNHINTVIDYDNTNGAWNGVGDVDVKVGPPQSHVFFNSATKANVDNSELSYVASAQNQWLKLMSSSALSGAPTSTGLTIYKADLLSFLDTTVTPNLTYNFAGLELATGHSGSFATASEIVIDAAVDITTSSGYHTMMHEFGHFYGIGHPGGAGDASGFNQAQTIMSYNAAAGGRIAITPMALDVAAIQATYGASTLNSGHGTIFSASSFGTTGYSFTGTNNMQTIWDAGGENDAFDLTSFHNGVEVDLREAVDSNGDWHDYKTIINSSTPGTSEWVYIARGTVIENAFGGNGNDKFIGNAADNLFAGYGGNDEFNGGAHGAKGDSVSYYYLNGSSYGGGARVNADLSTGEGKVYSTTDSLLETDTFLNIENLIGGDFNDTLVGDSNANRLEGGAGADRLVGGAGNDTFIIDNLDTIVDLEAGDTIVWGSDTLAGDAVHKGGDVWHLTVGGNTYIITRPGGGGNATIQKQGDSGSLTVQPSTGGSNNSADTAPPPGTSTGSGAGPGNGSGSNGGSKLGGINLAPAEDDPDDDNTPDPDNDIGNAHANFSNAALGQVTDPLVIDLDGDGIEFTSVRTSPVQFDIDGDSVAETTGWLHNDDGFLVRDRNSNGTVDDINDLYGNDSVLGFDMLRDDEIADGNGDGIITSADALYNELLVWRDFNHDGISQADELFTLNELGIASIDVRVGEVTSDDRWFAGNRLFESATVTYANNSTTGIHEVFFAQENPGGLALNGYAGSDAILLALPKSNGYGELLSWQDAMDNDATLQTMIEDFATRTDLNGWRADVEDILYQWAGVAGVNPTSRGSEIDARKLEFLEEAFDQPFNVGGIRPDPNGREAALLEQSWNTLLQVFGTRLLVQGPLAALFPNAEYSFANDTLLLGDTLEDILDNLSLQTYANDPSVIFTLREILINNRAGLDVSTLEINQAIAEKISAVLGDAGLEASIIASFNAENVVDHTTFMPNWYPSGQYVYNGTDRADLIIGSGNHDSLVGGAGADLIIGGAGNDYLTNTKDTYYDMGNYEAAPSDGDSLFGGDGNDTIYVIGHDLLLSGGAGNDLFDVREYSYGMDGSTISGGDGNDTIYADGNDLLVYGGDGQDQLLTRWGLTDVRNSYINMGDGNDTVNAMAYGNTIVGGAGDDYVLLVGNNNVVYGDEGNDTLIVNSNSYYGGPATVYGGSGDDHLTDYGNVYNPRVDLYDGIGNDTLSGSTISTTHFHITENTGDADVIDTGLWNSNHQIDLSDFEGITSFDDISMQQVGSDVVLDLGNGQTLTLVDKDIADVNMHMFWGAASSGTYTGTSGNDTITGSDTTHGGTGDDSLDGGAGNDQIDGSGGNDLVDGGDGNDYVFGGAGSDTIIGGLGDDTMYGGGIAGYQYNYSTNEYEPYGSYDTEADTFVITPEASSTDTIYILAPQNGDKIDLSAFTTITSIDDLTITLPDPYDWEQITTIQLPDSQVVRIQGGYPENISASTFIFYDPSIFGTSGADLLDMSAETAGQSVKALDGADTIIGSAYNDTLWGGAGDDVITAGDGDDIIIGGPGSDYIDGGNGNDTVSYADSSAWVNVDLANNNHWNGDAAWDNITGVEHIIGSAYNDNLTGTTGANAIVGGAGNDTISGLDGADTLQGGAGDDYIIAGDGDDIIEGGAGSDYIDGGNGIDTVSYASSSAAVNVDLGNNNHWGGDASWDNISNVENAIGSAHNDYLTGSAGANALTGGAGNDTLFGLDGDDTLDGGDGDDYIIGGDGNDFIIGGAGSDYIDGGAGIDTISYSNSSTWVNVDLLNNNQWSGDAAWDNVTGVENVIGSAYNDNLVGDTVANQLEGGDGNDSITGGMGADSLYGGSGADRFIFNASSDSDSTNGVDTIFDFSQADTDLLDFSAITSSAGSFLGTGAFTGNAFELKYYQSGGDTFVEMDTDGDMTGDMSIKLVGLHTLTGSDFVL